MKLEVRAVPSVEKVLLDEAPRSYPFRVRGLRREEVSWQIAYTLREDAFAIYLRIAVESPVADRVRVRQVRHVPVGMPTYGDADDNYLRKTPGLYPDLLREISPHNLRAYPERWDTLWVSIDLGDLPAGEYPVTVQLLDENGAPLAHHTQAVEVMDAELPAQTILHTEWLHCDCLAEHYRVPVWSEEHWRIIENFVREAVHGGDNMLLMPIHTPPLDTRVGAERLTTQLVDITLENGEYRFNMDRVRRWLRMCERCGVRYHEMAHLFTQWGAAHAPKIVAAVDGNEQRIFGWETDAAGPEYGAFLRQYIPALRAVFREEGLEDRVWWHISDEPNATQLNSYLATKNQVADVLQGANMMDALSHYEFYRDGLVPTPVVATTSLRDFLANDVPGLWAYYCCSQYRNVPNLFIAMPGARIRILGMLLHKYRLTGFLQWGFNFYHSAYSDYCIDPYAINDADGAFPAGDPFQVYPGADGMPESSIRHEVSREAFQDLRALQLLASLGGAEEAAAILAPLTLTDYPCGSAAFLELRERINDAIAKRL